MYSLLFLGVASFLLALSLTPMARSVFFRLGVVDLPNPQRKLHLQPIPRAGGIAIAAAYTLAFGLLLSSHSSARLVILGAAPLIAKLLPAAAIVFTTGLLDDLLQIAPWQKLVGQVAAAAVAFCAGIQVVGVGAHHFSWWLSFPATVVWLVACSNAVNLIDGLDGLAAGVALVASVTMAAAAFLQGNLELALATVPLAGCLLGFLRYNFNPATIFLGDSGSLLIGFLLGCYGVLWSEKSATVLGMAAPFMALSIPLLDTSLAVTRRFLRRQSIFIADRGHLHHRLLDLGLTQRTAALLLYGISILFAVLSLSLANRQFELIVVIAFCMLISIGVQRLRYIEFDTVGRMLRQGSFRNLLCSNISLQSFEKLLCEARTPDECWTVLKNVYQRFGFNAIQMRFAGVTYSDGVAYAATPSWRIEIPLSGASHIYLEREFNHSCEHNIVAPFADVLRSSLEAKLSLLVPVNVHPVIDTQPLPPPSQLWKTAGAGD